MSKRMNELNKLVDKSKKYTLDEACALLKNLAKAKFDESVNVSIKLGVDVKQTNQMVRGSVVLPHGTGKVPKVLVFVKGEKENDAKAAGADYVGADDLIEKINGGWHDFDVAIATPDMMKELGKVGKVLGPLGLMPNPKSGTVTADITRSVKEAKAGRVEFKVDPGAVIHTVIGKASFDAKKLQDNAGTLLEAVVKAKPAGVKGAYIQNIVIKTTMSPGLSIDTKPYLSVVA